MRLDNIKLRRNYLLLSLDMTYNNKEKEYNKKYNI